MCTRIQAQYLCGHTLATLKHCSFSQDSANPTSKCPPTPYHARFSNQLCHDCRLSLLFPASVPGAQHTSTQSVNAGTRYRSIQLNLGCGCPIKRRPLPLLLPSSGSSSFLPPTTRNKEHQVVREYVAYSPAHTQKRPSLSFINITPPSTPPSPSSRSWPLKLNQTLRRTQGLLIYQRRQHQLQRSQPQPASSSERGQPDKNPLPPLGLPPSRPLPTLPPARSVSAQTQTPTMPGQDLRAQFYSSHRSPRPSPFQSSSSASASSPAHPRSATAQPQPHPRISMRSPFSHSLSSALSQTEVSITPHQEVIVGDKIEEVVDELLEITHNVERRRVSMERPIPKVREVFKDWDGVLKPVVHVEAPPGLEEEVESPPTPVVNETETERRERGLETTKSLRKIEEVVDGQPMALAGLASLPKIKEEAEAEPERTSTAASPNSKPSSSSSSLPPRPELQSRHISPRPLRATETTATPVKASPPPLMKPTLPKAPPASNDPALSTALAAEMMKTPQRAPQKQKQYPWLCTAHMSGKAAGDPWLCKRCTKRRAASKSSARK